MRVTLVGLLLLVVPASPGAQSVAIVDVTVIPMDRETTLAHHTVVVRGERIVSVGPTENTPVPDDAVIIDATGRYLVPGLTDAHVHLAGGRDLPRRQQLTGIVTRESATFAWIRRVHRRNAAGKTRLDGGLLKRCHFGL